jgi:hypothetical protein
MKFKRGALTGPPQTLIGELAVDIAAKPAHRQTWDQAFETM